MNKKDYIFILAVVLFFMPFFVLPTVYDGYININKNHGMIMSFIKFSLLATLGEVIGLRIRTGFYNQKGFGILPRAIVWGFLGLFIKLAFIIFTSGTIDFLLYMGFSNVKEMFTSGLTIEKVLIAALISISMNTIFAPVMMTFHKITDTHILNYNGSISCIFKPINFSKILSNINWDVQWNFVLKKTIPLFWYPAHTITFLLPADFQVLFAAILGIALGVILAIASHKSRYI